jgi:hypothetical protein
MPNTVNPQAFRDLDEHGSVIYIDNLIGCNPDGIERQLENIHVRFSQMHKTG